MIPGDEWTPERGFLSQSNDFFENYTQRLNEYAERLQPTLAQYYVQEEKTRVSLSLMRKFFGNVWRRTPYLLRCWLENERILITSFSGNSRNYFSVNLASGGVEEVAAETAGLYPVRAEFPAIILAQSIRMNMFSQAWISKRVHYFTTKEKKFALTGFLRILELNEAELLPLRHAANFRSVRALFPRWREGLLYLQVLFHLLRRRNFLEIENRLLNA